MDFGVVLQTNPPAWRTVQLAQLAEAHGFEPRVDVRLAPALAGAVRHLQPDPGADQPGDRRADGHQPGHPRLDGHRLAVRHAERDVRQPDGLRHRPRRLGGPGHQRQADDARASCARRRTSSASSPTAGRSTTTGTTLRFPWARTSQLEVWVAAYGPLALKAAGEVGDGFILQLADLDIAAVDDRGRPHGREQRRPRPGRAHLLRRRAGLRRGRPGAHARPVPLVRRHGRQPRRRHRGRSTATSRAPCRRR